MEDIVKIKTGWGKVILSKLISSALKKAGYDIEITIEDFEAENADTGDNVIAKVTATVAADKRSIHKLLK